MHKLVSSLLLLLLILVGCSSISHEPAKDYRTHFLCFNQDKTTEHYFVNTFVFAPTAKQKQCELLLGKLRMEKQLQIRLIDCREIAAEDVPSDLDLSSLNSSTK